MPQYDGNGKRRLAQTANGYAREARRSVGVSIAENAARCGERTAGEDARSAM